MAKEILIKVTGKVQEVFFRAEAKKIAEQLGISGYVKNQPDGSLIIVAQGKEEAIKKFANWCKKGPEAAQVKNIQKLEQPIKIIYQDFEIKI